MTSRPPHSCGTRLRMPRLLCVNGTTRPKFPISLFPTPGTTFQPCAPPSAPRDFGLCAKGPPVGVCQNDRCFYLSFRDVPVFLEQPILVFARNHPKAVLFIEADRPTSVGPGPNQHGVVG